MELTPHLQTNQTQNIQIQRQVSSTVRGGDMENHKINIQTFLNRRLEHILGIYWPNTITNIELWQTTQQEQLETQMKHRKWGWIGHTLWKLPSNTTRQALTWNPQGKRDSWKISAGTQGKGKSWKEAEKDAQLQTSLKRFINDL